MTDKFRLQWPVDDRTITQYFGENPQIYARFNQAGHEGIDFSTPVGGNVYACADGKVFAVRPNNGNAYGLHVRVRHRVGNHEYHTIYAHLSKVLVSADQPVGAGEQIALSGNTGHSFDPHLHLTLKLIGAKTIGYPDGVIDPLPYLEEAELPASSDLTIYTTDKVRLRARPTTTSAHLTWLEKAEPLTVLGNAEAARVKVGEREEWIQVQHAGGMSGFVAAWYTQLRPPAPTPEPTPEPEPHLPDSLTIYATEALNVRNGPSTGSSRIAVALPHEPLTAAGNWEDAIAKIGDRSEWLHVYLPDPIGEGQRGRSGYVAAWYVQVQPSPAPENVLTVYPSEDINMRERPALEARRTGRLMRGAPLTVNDDPERARALVGRYDEWLYVETEEDKRGWAAAWHTQTHPPEAAEPGPTPEPAGPLVVYAAEALNVRNNPSTGASRIAIALPHEPLSAIGDRQAALSRLGEWKEWLRIRLPGGNVGYVAAWYVQTDPGPAPETLLTVYPTQEMNMRARPTVRVRCVGQPAHNAPLTVHDDPERARALVGRYDEWLYVETEDGERGWVAAWYVSDVKT